MHNIFRFAKCMQFPTPLLAIAIACMDHALTLDVIAVLLLAALYHKAIYLIKFLYGNSHIEY